MTKLRTAQIDPTNSEAMTSWTPTWTNASVGNGTVVAKYVQVGRRVTFVLTWTLGSTSTVGTDVKFSLPVTPSSDMPETTAVGFATAYNGGYYSGFAWKNGSNVWVVFESASGAYSQFFGMVSNVPFTWANGNILTVHGEYSV